MHTASGIYDCTPFHTFLFRDCGTHCSLFLTYLVIIWINIAISTVKRILFLEPHPPFKTILWYTTMPCMLICASGLLKSLTRYVIYCWIFQVLVDVYVDPELLVAYGVFLFFSVDIGVNRYIWIWSFWIKTNLSLLFQQFHVSLFKWPFINEPNGIWKLNQETCYPNHYLRYLYPFKKKKNNLCHCDIWFFTF